MTSKDISTTSSSLWPFSTRSTAMIIGAGSALGLGLFVYKAINAPLSDDGGSFEQSFTPVIKRAESETVTNEFKFARHAQTPETIPLLILFGTEYGCSKEIALKLESEIYSAGKFYPRVVDMEDFELIEWNKEQIVLIVTSTYGDGVPPTRARRFFDYMEANRINLSHIHFSVLGLGDSSYPHFCRAGKTMDRLFEDYGAKRFHKKSEVDLEDWSVIDRWCDNVLEKIPNLSVNQSTDYLWDKVSNYVKKESFNRQKPYYAKLIIKQVLTQQLDKEDKETIHFEFDLADSGIQYVVGDSLGILPVNCTDEVNELLKQLKADPKMSITLPSWKYEISTIKGNSAPLKDVLSYFYDLKNIKPKLLQLLLVEAEKQKKTTEANKLKELLKDGVSTNQNKVMNDYFYGREIHDVLNEFSAIKLTNIPEFLNCMGQLLPRYYSISSSMLTDPTKVTVTIAVVRYHSNNKARKGVTSTYIADRIKVGDVVPVFVNNNPDFRLPEDPAKGILMIGPGTGIAPFRAMLQERIKSNSTGSNTLYFGCRMSTRDFLYKEELANYEAEKQLTLHTAFSRDQEKKIYVQHKLADQATEIWQFMQDGGHIYICGDAQYMERDVYKTLLEIISNHGQMDHVKAEEYLKNLESSKRYQKDTWF